ncbi:MAG: glycoside hydrolase family 3 N-terminal domain-containing protein, partial [Terriglobia bacterium]
MTARLAPHRGRARRPALAVLIVLLLACLPASTEEPLQRRSEDKLPRGAERWVRRTLSRMTLEEKVGQLLMVPYFGGFTNTESPTYRRLLRLLEEQHVGGLMVATRSRPGGFDRSDVYALAHLTNTLQQAASLPLLVSADFERGADFRVRETTSFPHNMTVGATGNPDYAYWMGRIAATEARALGVHWLLAPVADVNNNPLNPIINIRSFGEDPAQVSAMVAAFARGCAEAHALCTAKHFPGTGDITLDPHLELATVEADRERLHEVELAPFRAAIAAGIGAIMTEHIAVPALDPNPGGPATFSYAITTELLRERMGFQGLIITDAMRMSAIASQTWAGEAAVRAVQAGADVVLMSPDPVAAAAALKRAVKSGRIPAKRLEQSVERILRAKARLNLHRNRLADPEQLDQVLANRFFNEKAQEMADHGVALLRDHQQLLPLDATRPQRGFLLAVSADPDIHPGTALERELKPRVDSLIVQRTDRVYFQPDEIELPNPSLYDWAIVAVSVRIADRKGNVALPEELANVVHRLLAGEKPVALVILGSPYLAERFPQAKTVLCTFSTARIAERAAVRALFGQTRIGGRLPVTIPEIAERGAGLDRPAFPMDLAPALPEDRERLAPVRALLDAAVANGVFPGGVLAVGYQGRLAALHPFGGMTYDEDAAPVRADTLYDLASLTKVVATTSAAMVLYERRRLPLEAPVVDFVPELKHDPDGEAKAHIQIRHLLTHSSGLPGYIRLFQQVDTREKILDSIYKLPLEYPTGSRSVYSDLGIILLGEVLERASGRPLDLFLRENLFDPLGMHETLFNPPARLRDRIAPTEEDPDFRGRLIQGEVHDENAWVMGGVAPHAGLFSTARDL